MRRMTVLAVLGTLALMLAGCAASTPEPTPATAVDVAGVIEPYKSEWIEAANTQGDCLESWVFEKQSGADCYMLADRVDTTTAIALQDLGALVAPDGRESDFNTLKRRLEDASALKIRAACGTGAVPDLEMKACADLVVDRVTALGLLNRELTKWP